MKEVWDFLEALFFQFCDDKIGVCHSSFITVVLFVSFICSVRHRKVLICVYVYFAYGFENIKCASAVDANLLLQLPQRLIRLSL